MKKYLIVVLAFSTLIGTVSAQQKWSLEQCIDYAWKNNLTIKTTALNAESQKIRSEQAKNQRLPDLNASLSSPLSYGQAQNALGYNEKTGKFTTSISGGLSSSVTLFSGFQITNNIAAQAFNLQASLEDLKKAKESMAVNIASAYLQVLYNKELYQIAKDQVDLSQAQVTRSESLASYGKIPEGQVFEVRAQLSKDKLSATESQNTLLLSLLDLSQLLDLKEWSTFDVVEPSIDVQSLSMAVQPAEEIFNQAVSTKATVKASEYRLKSSEKSLEVTKAAQYPRLSLNAYYGNGYYPDLKKVRAPGDTITMPFGEQWGQNYSAGLTLSLSIPIFNRFDTKNNIRLSKIDLENAKLELENTKKTLYKEIQQAWFNATKATVQYSSAGDVVLNSEEAFRFAEEKYNNGKATIYEYNQAKMNLASAKSSQLQAKYNYVFCIKILDFYKGEPLKL
jgi:outer membrane protein